MVTKKIISLNLFFALATSCTQYTSSGNEAFQKAKDAKNIAATPCAPAAAAAAVTSSSTVSTVHAGLSIISHDSTIGQPYPTVIIDPAIQNNPYTAGAILNPLTAITGSRKGVNEPSLAYVLRLTRDGQLGTVLKQPRLLDPKILERFSEGLKEGDISLTKLITTQSTECKNSLAQQQSAAKTFLDALVATVTSFLTQRRATFHKTTSDIDTILQVVHKMPDAEGSLSPACIQEELIKLLAIQRQKENDLKLQQDAAKTLLQQLTQTLTSITLQQEAESQAQIIKTRELRELLHNSHSSPDKLVPLSPRKTTAAAAASSIASSTTSAASAEGKGKK